MTTPRDFFTVELEWEQRGSLFVLRNDDRSAETRAFQRAAEDRLFRPRGVVRADIVLAPSLPVWTLLHVNPDPYGSMWCFVEQGRDGAFGASGGCRASFVKLGRHHPADVWRAGRDLAWSPAPGRGEPDLPMAREVLASLAADRNRVPLPADAVDNAQLIEAVLAVLPARVVAGWLWSTHLFGAADRYVAGRLDGADPPQLPATVPAEYAEAFEWLATELAGVSEEAERAVRASRADSLADFLRSVSRTGGGVRAVARADRALAPAVAAPAPAPAGRHSPPAGADLSTEATQRLPSPGAVARARGVAMPLTWVEWADMGRGFDRLGDEAQHTRLRRYWAAAEALLDSEKVPNGVDTTLGHPLWTVRRVNVDGVGTQWCFVERGRGNLVGPDRQPLKERQFGMAGGCRFGFASFAERPADVWQAGEANAWTLVHERTRPTTVYSGILRRLLAALGAGQARVCLPGLPDENRLVIGAVLAVLPGPLAARWVWSTCLFKVTDAYVAGAVPSDVHDSEPISRLAAQVAAKKLPASEEPYLAGLDGKQREAFERLAQWAEKAMTKRAIRRDFTQLAQDSTATGLTDFLTEMANRLKLSERRVDEVPTALLTAEGQDSLHHNDAEVVTQFAELSPAEARRHLSTHPESPVAPEMTEGLRNRQAEHPAENLFDIPTTRSSGSRWTRESTRLLRRHTDEEERSELIRAATQPGGFLHDPRDLIAAEPFVRDMELPFERYPQYYPARLMQEIETADAVRGVAESGLRASARPDTLLFQAARRIKQPTVTKAAWVMLMLDEVMAGAPSAVQALRETAAVLLGTQPRKEQATFWAAVMQRYPPREVSDTARARLFDAGVQVLYARNKRQPLVHTELHHLKETIGPSITVPILPEPEPRERVGLVERMRAWLARFGQRRRAATPGGGGGGLGILAAGIVIVGMVGALVLSALEARSPTGSTPLSPSPARPGASSPAVLPTTAGPASSAAAPTTKPPAAGPPERLQPFPVEMQSMATIEQAVEQIVQGVVDRSAGRPVVSVALDYYALSGEQAEDGAAGAEKRVAARLPGAEVKAYPHTTKGPFYGFQVTAFVSPA